MSRSSISEIDLDRSNDVWRTTPLYQEALRAVGADPSRPIKLSEQQRQQLHQYVAQRGMVLPHGTEFDPAGNVNRDDRGFAESGLGKTLIAAGAIGASLFIPGVAPAVLNGLQGAGSAAMGVGGSAAGAAGSAASAVVALTPTRDVAREMFQLFGGAASTAADRMAANRGVQFSADTQRAMLQQQSGRDFFDQQIAREGAGRDKDRNAWEMMNRASSVVNAPDNLNKTMLSPYSKALAGPDQFVREQAAKFGNRSAVELDEGNTLEAPKRVGADVNLEDAGAWEKAMGIGATAAGVAQAIPGGFWSRVGRWIR